MNTALMSAIVVITLDDIRAYRETVAPYMRPQIDSALAGDQDAWWLVRRAIAEQRRLNAVLSQLSDRDEAELECP
jgi:hypothetical protein